MDAPVGTRPFEDGTIPRQLGQQSVRHVANVARHRKKAIPVNDERAV